jgi:hypothetical protein
VGTESDIREERYRTQLAIVASDMRLSNAESDFRSDFGFNFLPLSDIRHALTSQNVLARHIEHYISGVRVSVRVKVHVRVHVHKYDHEHEHEREHEHENKNINVILFVIKSLIAPLLSDKIFSMI